MTEKQLIENITEVVNNEMNRIDKTYFLHEAMKEINLWNGAFEETLPYDMDYFDELHSIEMMTPLQVINSIDFEAFNVNDDYFVMYPYCTYSLKEIELADYLEDFTAEIIENFVDVLHGLDWEDFTPEIIKALVKEYIESEGK